MFDSFRRRGGRSMRSMFSSVKRAEKVIIKIEIGSESRPFGLTSLVLTEQDNHNLVKLTAGGNLKAIEERINALSFCLGADTPPSCAAPFWAETNLEENYIQVSGNLVLFFEWMKSNKILPENILDGLPKKVNDFINSTKKALPLDPERNAKSSKCVIC